MGIGSGRDLFPEIPAETCVQGKVQLVPLISCSNETTKHSLQTYSYISLSRHSIGQNALCSVKLTENCVVILHLFFTQSCTKIDGE